MESPCFELLDAAYAALDRKLLQQILRNHWKYRDPVLAYIDILDDWYL
jgi:beta-glucosidase-like glycosyl hydrolase